MTVTPTANRYKQALADFVASSNEASLEAAYDIGRDALKNGLSLGEVGELHYSATHELITDQRIALATLERSEEFFLQIAAVYDMALRGYRQTIGRLQVEIEQRRAVEDQLRLTASELARERDLLEQRVTERTEVLRLQAEELKQKNEELRRRNRELDDFIHIASHDLKEPLRAISNHAIFLLEDYQESLDEEARQRMERLVKLSARMTQLIADLRNLSYLARADHTTETVDLREVIDGIEASLADMLQARNARIVVAEPLPVVRGNRALVTALFQNLISNATKFNDACEKIVEIGASADNADEAAAEFEVLYVRDNGIGIETQFHDEIFRVFKRLNSENAYGEGTGAGLSIVKKIVENQGGRIWLTSQIGQGTTFYFTLIRPASS